MSTALWILQALLALLFLFAGATKLVIPTDQLAQMIPLPALLVRFVGLAECLGALGLLLPGLLHIRPRLTILAALELAHVMLGATLLTLVTMDAVAALMPLVVGCLCGVVAYGRARRAPFDTTARRRSAAAPAAA